MYVKSLHIERLRCFQEADVTFQYPGRKDSHVALPNVNLVLGENGAGKTTVLKAIALGALWPVIDSSGFFPYYLVRRARSAVDSFARVSVEIVLHAQDVGSEDQAFSTVDRVGVRIGRRRDFEHVENWSQVGTPFGPGKDQFVDWDGIFDNELPGFLLVGYGASRQVESATTFDAGARRKSRHLRYQRVAGLFEESVTLTPLAAWLPNVRADKSRHHEQIVGLINGLLPDGYRFTGKMDDADYLFDHHEIPVPFAALSDGYRAYIGWIVDLLYHLSLGCPPDARLVDSKGIVLIDEIDLHLHPEWQRTVVPTVANTFPNLQFVITSHSPIVAGTLQSANILVTEVGDDGTATVRQLTERIYGLSAEQILLSSYFNLASTRAQEAEDQLGDLAHQAQTGDSGAAIEYLRRLTEGIEENGGRPAGSARSRSRTTNRSR